MKLDFTVLSRPAAAALEQTARGHTGTVGTPASMRVSASSRSGDGLGTGGDMRPGAGVDCIAAAGAGDRVGPRCPPASPRCPHAAAPGQPREIAVSPLPPLVPSMAATDEGGDAFEREAFEERAAIMEFDGGLTRADAEAAARALLETTTSINAKYARYARYATWCAENKPSN
jgi:hypothetical protein